MCTYQRLKYTGTWEELKRRGFEKHFRNTVNNEGAWSNGNIEVEIANRLIYWLIDSGVDQEITMYDLIKDGLVTKVTKKCK